MKIIADVKKKYYMWSILLLVSFALLAAAFGVHCYNVNRYNAATHNITVSGAEESGVSVDIHPRGQSTDVWDKQDAVLGVTLKGMIYEITVSNNSGYRLNDWQLIFNFNEKGFVNNAWCGTVELNQILEEGSISQTLDLRDYSRDDLKLSYHVSGNDLLLNITPGSSLIYHPSTADNETPIDDGGSVSSGIIFYTYGDDVDLSDFDFEFHLHKGYLDGSNTFVGLFGLWLLALIIFISLVIMSMHYERRLRESDQLIRQSLDVFTNFVDAKDPYTKGHSGRVAEYSRMIAKKLGMDDERCEQVYYIALLHDIGKCYVPDEILKKPSRLTDEEFNIIKTHTTHGAEMVKNFSSIPGIRDGALYHHERYDGKGYPTGRKGEDIPLIGRIICVADSFDAMNSSRVYRKKLPLEAIIAELEKNKGTQFDPKLADIFLKILREGAVDSSDQ